MLSRSSQKIFENIEKTSHDGLIRTLNKYQRIIEPRINFLDECIQSSRDICAGLTPKESEDDKYRSLNESMKARKNKMIANQREMSAERDKWMKKLNYLKNVKGVIVEMKNTSN